MLDLGREGMGADAAEFVKRYAEKVQSEQDANPMTNEQLDEHVKEHGEDPSENME